MKRYSSCLINSIILLLATICNFNILFINAKPGCVRWRQTGGCSPDGPREPGGDRGWGYEEVEDGMEEDETMQQIPANFLQALIKLRIQNTQQLLEISAITAWTIITAGRSAHHRFRLA